MPPFGATGERQLAVINRIADFPKLPWKQIPSASGLPRSSPIGTWCFTYG